MTHMRKFEYRGKHFSVPEFSGAGFQIVGGSDTGPLELPEDSPVLQDLGTVWDLEQFKRPRRPVQLGLVPEAERARIAAPGMPRTLDLPIKFPGSAYRVPREFLQLHWLIQRVADLEARFNPRCHDEFYCYMTVDQGTVPAGNLQREAPCHVDGFQGARWTPKQRINHTYTLTDCLPTVYYEQPFDFSALDPARHNVFWEMNRQVAATRSAHAWRAAPWELTIMDAYTVHRGAPAPIETQRVWVRLSFEVRVFDRLGNAHNPLFRYAWEMVPRDIEGLGLVAWDPDTDPSLRVFPWQGLDGQPLENRQQKTQPRLDAEPDH